ncbi:MAG: hypothetical protein KBG24_01350 [Bacteroidia bacterium]|nr:hypothetical protein [Bacteroidia bacterium]MBP9724696.1 hypothetical protein [Bacteroidia bacterium]
MINKQLDVVDSNLLDSELFIRKEFYSLMGEERIKELKDTSRVIIRLTTSFPFDSMALRIYKIESRRYSDGKEFIHSIYKHYPNEFNPFLLLGDPSGKSIETYPRIFEQKCIRVNLKSWKAILQNINEMGIWGLTSQRCNCFDGNRYQLEVNIKGRYKYLFFDNPQPSDTIMSLFDEITSQFSKSN